MLNTIILSIAFFLVGMLVGMWMWNSIGDERVKKIKLDDGSEIHMWKGFTDQNNIFVCHNTDENGNYIDGDKVLFDKNGSVNFIIKNVEET